MSKEFLDALSTSMGTNRNEITQYKDLVNQKDPREDLGNAFLELGKRPGLNAKQKASNAFFTAFGAGLNSTASRDRKDKLKEIEEWSKEVAINTAKAQKQIGEYKLTQAAYANYGLQNFVTFKGINEMIKSGDEEGLSANLPRVYNDFKAQNPDIVKKLGNYDHYDNGRIYLEKDGQITGIYVRDLMSNITSNLPEDLQKEVPYLNSIETQKKFNREERATDLAIQEKSANIANSYASAEANKAHGEYYKAQAQTEQRKINAPILSEEQKNQANFNRNLIKEEIAPQLKANEAILGVYESLEKIIRESPAIVGKDYKSRAWRELASAFGLDPNIDYAALKSVEFEKMLKPILGGQLGEKEGERVLNKFVSLDQHPASIKKFLEEEKSIVIQQLIRGNNQVKAFNENSYNNLYDDKLLPNLDTDIDAYKEERKRKKSGKKSWDKIGRESLGDLE